MVQRARLVSGLVVGFLLLGVAPAEALEATPPLAVWAETTSVSFKDSVSTERNDAAATIRAATASVPERITVAGPQTQLRASISAVGAGTLLSPGTYQQQGTSQYSTTAAVRAGGVPPDCFGAWQTTLVVLEAVHTAGVLTSFAADYSVTCYYQSNVTSTVRSRTTGSVRYGSSIPYAVLGIDAAWTKPGPLPMGESETLELPITVLGSGSVSIDSIALDAAVVTPSVSLVGDTCGARPAVVSASSPCTVSVLVSPVVSSTTVARAGVLITTSSGGVVRVERDVVVRYPLEPAYAQPYPTSSGISVGLSAEQVEADTYTFQRRPAGGGAVTTLATDVAYDPFAGAVLHVDDPSAQRGVAYEYSALRRTADGRFSVAGPWVAITRPATDPVPTARTRVVADTRDGQPLSSASLDTDTGLETTVSHDRLGTTVILNDPVAVQQKATFRLPPLPGPGVHSLAWQPYATVTVPPTLFACTVEGADTIRVRSVLYDVDGTLLALDASLRTSCSPSGETTEIRFRTGGTPAVAVVSALTGSTVADPLEAAPPLTFTVTNRGPGSAVIGSPSVSGAGAAQWSAGACVPSTLASGASCTLTATFTGTALPSTSVAVLAASVTAAGAREDDVVVGLSGRTSDVPGTPDWLVASREPYRAVLRWPVPADDGGRPITTYVAERAPEGTSDWQAVDITVFGATVGVDESPLPGAATYRVAAVSSRGQGPWTGAATTTSNTKPVVEVGTVAELTGGLPWGLHLGTGIGDADLPLEVDGHEHDSATATADGRSVVYSRAATAGPGEYDFDLYRMGLAPGSSRTQLTSMPGAEVDPAVSPDGSTLLFTYYPPAGAASLAPEVWSMPLAGGTPTKVRDKASHPSWMSMSTIVATDESSLTAALLTFGPTGLAPAHLAGTEGGADPSVSPDGKRIAYSDAEAYPAIYTVAGGAVDVSVLSSLYLYFRPTWIGPNSVSVSRVRFDTLQPVVAIDLFAFTELDTATSSAIPMDDGAPPVIGAGPSAVKPGATVRYPVSDASSARGGVTVRCGIDGGPVTIPCTSGIVAKDQAGASFGAGTHTITVRAVDPFGNTTTVDRTLVVDALSPSSASITIPTYTTSTKVTATFRASDANGVASYEVRQRTWPIGQSAPNLWTSLTTAQTTSTRSIVVPSRTRVCIQARAKDVAGNVGAWGVEKCTTSPLDDSQMRGVDNGWVRTKSSAYYKGTATYAKKTGLRIAPGVHVSASRVGVIASTCPTCGSVSVYLADVRLGTINLASSTTTASRVFLLPQGKLRSGVLELRTTSGKLVRIDGVILLR